MCCHVVIDVSDFKTLCPTHPLLHNFHLVLQTQHYIVAWQTLLQLDDVFDVFGYLGS